MKRAIRSILAFALGVATVWVLYTSPTVAAESHKQHQLVFAVQLHVDGLADKVIFFTEEYKVLAYDQAQLDWEQKRALMELRKLGAVGDLQLQTPCGVGK
jgi:hypothetical protein